jgi:hypothetical protein
VTDSSLTRGLIYFTSYDRRATELLLPADTILRLLMRRKYEIKKKKNYFALFL